MRQIIVDTETTGLDPAQGHRIIEIGCVELRNRRATGNNFHRYLNPERDVDPGAVEIHGLDAGFLADKPRFADIAEELLAYLRDADLIIHNAPFDVGFLNHELALLEPGRAPIEDLCSITDTLEMARRMHPGQRNSLDALCRRYGVDNSQRDLHGALLDAEILADVYLRMTGGQVTLALGGEGAATPVETSAIRPVAAARSPLRVVYASAQEVAAHDAYLTMVEQASGGRCLWLRLAEAGPPAPTDGGWQDEGGAGPDVP
jgi:DNA polymerase-3 subunit epsilon